MTYTEAISYLYSRLPVFHRVGVLAYKPGLQNVLALCEAVGNPQHQFKSIHVAGTNGKGSTSHLLASVYQTVGYRVGLYTSPHLTSFTERIRLNGQVIAEQDVADFVEELRPTIEAIQPSFFEVTVAMAFAYFARQQVDLAVIEVGLGGRLDSTNIIVPQLSIITNIGWDHMDVLGHTLPEIALEKAGIIKPGVPVVVGEVTEETQSVFSTVAASHAAPLLVASEHWMLEAGQINAGYRQVDCWSVKSRQNISLQVPLPGLYQLANLSTVLTAVDSLQAVFPIQVRSLVNGCRDVIRLTGLRGRFQWLSNSPSVIADTAHNLPGIAAVMETALSIPHRILRLVLGFARDKALVDMLILLPSEAVYYFCQADSPRAMLSTELAEQAGILGRHGRHFTSVNDALTAARMDAASDDLILVTGSTYLVAELTELN